MLSAGRAVRSATFLVMLAGVVCAARVVVAVDAEALVREGLELRRKGQDAAALERFRDAQKIAASPRVTAQIGMAEHALGHWRAADTHLRESLRAAEDPWVTKNRAALEQSLAKIAQHLGTLEITGAPEGAEVRVDGELIGTLPLPGPIRVPAGSVAVDVRYQGFLSVARSALISVGTLTRENFVLQPATSTGATIVREPALSQAVGEARPRPAIGAPLAPPHSADVQAAQQPSRVRSVIAWSMAGAAIGAIAVAGLETIQWQNRVAGFGDRPECGTTATEYGGAECKRLYDEGHRALVVSLIGYGAAAALAATSLVLFTSHRPPRPESHVACVPDPLSTGIACLARF